MSIHIVQEDTVEIHIQGGIDAARAMTSIFMVHSVVAINGVRKVTRDLYKDENSSQKSETEKSRTFSDILQQEVDVRRKDSLDCRTVTYGMDKRLHSFEYLAREYRY